MICLLLMLLIIFARAANLPVFGEPPEDSLVSDCVLQGQRVSVVGTVTDRRQKNRSTQLILTNSYLRSESRSISLKKISVTADPEAAILAGSVVVVSGILSQPEGASNPGQFDLHDYYAGQQIYYTLYAEEWEILEKGGGIRETLLSLRNALLDRIDRMTGPETASALKAVLLGDRSGLTEEEKRNYQVGGILHIFAISGMHISFLGRGFLKLLQRLGLPLLPAAGVSFLTLACYCFITGAAASSLRAVCMFAVYLGGRILLRTYDPLCALALAGILLLLENPSLLFTSGFQLSFCAILAVSAGWHSVSWLLPPQVKKPGTPGKGAVGGRAELRQRRKRQLFGWLRYFGRLVLRYSLFWFSLTVILLPLTIWYYYEIPVFGLLPNLLLVPGAPVLLASGTAGLAVGAVSLEVGGKLLLPADWIVTGLRDLTERIRTFPLATWVCGKPALWQLLATELLLLLLLAVLYKGREIRDAAEDRGKKVLQRRYRKMGAAGLLLMMIILLVRPQPDWSLTMLDVGQGDCLVLRERENCFLVDGGSSTVKEVGKYRILPYLKSQGVHHLKGIFVSHPDEDHTNGLLEVFAAISSRQATLRADYLYLPLWMRGTKEERALRQGAEAADTEVVYLARGDRITTDQMEICVLNPFPQGGIQRGNSGSLVLSLSCGSFDALLTGDLEQDGERLLLPLEKNYEYLKTAHHGSSGSTSKAFLEAVQPQVAVISAPVRSRYGHPHRETLQRLEDAGTAVYCTRDRGALRAWGSGDTWRMEGFLPAGTG